MAKTIEDLFFGLAFATDAFIILQLLFIYKRTQKLNYLWILLAYTIINLLINSLVDFLDRGIVETVYACFTLIEYTLFAFFIRSITTNTFFRKLIVVLSVLFCLLLPVYYTNFKQRIVVDSVPIGCETILVLLFAFYYFYEQMNDIENHYIYNRFHFWIVTGIILYLAGSFFIYISANHIDKQIVYKYWFLTYIFYVIKNALFITGISIYNIQNKHKQQSNLYPSLN
jgi:hypothetical protein